MSFMFRAWFWERHQPHRSDTKVRLDRAAALGCYRYPQTDMPRAPYADNSLRVSGRMGWQASLQAPYL